MELNDNFDYINGFADNIKEVLQRYKTFVGFNEIHDTDDALIGSYPAITIELDNFREYWTEMPRRRVIEATYNINWYYRQYDDSIKRKKVREGLNKIAGIFRENWKLNNYCPRLGVEINSATPYLIMRGENIVAGGVIVLTCKKVVDVVFS